MTVYVVQNQMKRNQGSGALEPAFDLTPAREYGRLEFLLPSSPVPLDAGPMVKQLNEKLQQFDEDEDFVVAIGNPVAIAAAAAIIAANCQGVVPLLVWDRQVRRYNAVRIDIGRT
jgi:hypothetical protein